MPQLDLRRLDVCPAPPFTVDVVLDTETRVLRCLSVERFLPGRRLVAVANLDGGRVLAKLLFGPTARRRSRREQLGVRQLMDAGVATPRLLQTGRLPHGTGEVLVFEYLPDARIPGQPEVTGGPALDAIVAVIARLHDHGTRQTDLHLDNFLEVGDVVYAIDGGGVRPLSGGRHAALANLARFAAELDPHRQLDQRVFDSYCRARGWSVNAARRTEFLIMARRARRQRVERFLAKTLRTCSQFEVVRSFGAIEVVERDAVTPALRAVLADLDGAIASGEVVKAGNTATVCRVWRDTERFIVKRYNVKSAMHGLRLLLRSSRARNTWCNGHGLLLQGIRTARPLALVERAFGLRAYVVLEDLGDSDLAGIVEREGATQAVLAEVAHLFEQLDAAALHHGDTKATNFLLRDHRLHVIDLDGLRPGNTRQRRQDVERFLDNWSGRTRAAFEAVLVG